MFKLNVSLVVLIIYDVVTYAAVIKEVCKEKTAIETSTDPIDDVVITMRTEITTIKNDSFDVSNDNKGSTEKLGALSRDEEAAFIIVDQILLDPAPSELIKSEAKMVQIEKSGKLLLLSTPKIAEKPKQPEENPDESEEIDEAVENITEIPIETTTAIAQNDVTTEEILEAATKSNENQITEKQTTISPFVDVTRSTDKITKLYPINDTLYDNKNESKIEATVKFALNVDNESKKTPSLHLGSTILEKTAADYVLVDSDVSEGFYTDADSELHLQPIVQSVEIVPASFDDTLLINYVQSW